MNINQPHHALPAFTDDLLLKALQTSQDATAIYITEDLHIRFANDAMLKIWGKPKTIVGMRLEDALPELEGQPFGELLRRVWRTGITYSVFDTPADLVIDGELGTYYFDFEYRALKDADQKTWCIIHTTKDVTQRRAQMLRLEQKEEEEQALTEEMAATLEELLSTNEELNNSLTLLADSREYIRTLIQQAPVGICMLEGPQHIIAIANSAILKIWGRTKAEVIDKPHRLARPELEGQPVNGWLDAVFSTGKPQVNSEFRVMLYAEGKRREAFVNSIYQPIRSSIGEITGVLVILEEITDQVRARKEHEKNQQMLSMAIDAGGLATFYYETQTNLFSGNAMLKSWFGLGNEENLDLDIALSAIEEDDRGRVAAAIARALEKGSDGNYGIEYRIRSINDMPARTIQATGKVFYDVLGIATSLNGTLRDVTEQKKDEQRKDDFISMVSHELKTPLTSLTAYIQLLQRKAKLSGDTQLQSTLDKALKQIRSMAAMINGFLNVSRLDSGKMAIDAAAFNLDELFGELQEELQSTILTHHIHFGPATGLNLVADRNKIAQVIQNLVGNAAKYSPMGSKIMINAGKDLDQVSVSVSDQGMGISKEDQQFIFDRYYRVKNRQMGSIAGFGIGLYLCREIIEHHRGKISLLSEPQKGTIFTFSLPLETDRNPAKKKKMFQGKITIKQ
ncbi:ATP-binding protein [Pedobacter sp. GSP4]|uniref:ATP-binding protein n=1 Tax=Pedobacter sp. GSP4 TaxID=3453716 RepID=UPI003EEFAF3F